MQHTYPIPYSIIGFFLLDAVNEGKTCTPDEIKQAIYDEDLDAFFTKNGVRNEPSLYSSKIYQELQELVDIHMDHKLLPDAKNGYLLLTSYLLELIQRQAPNRQP